MSISQDWDLDEIINHSRSLNIDVDLAVKKYYQIYQFLQTQDEYKNNDYKRTEACVVRTKNWLTAYATAEKTSFKSKPDENKTNH